jgi:hypothetical protein
MQFSYIVSNNNDFFFLLNSIHLFNRAHNLDALCFLYFKLECCSNAPISVTEELNCYGDLIVPKAIKLVNLTRTNAQ